MNISVLKTPGKSTKARHFPIRLRHWGFLFLLLMIVACGRQSEGEYLTCDWQSNGYCEQFTGVAYEKESAAASCSGAFDSTGRCSVEDLAGSCYLFDGSPNEKRIYFYSNKFKESEAATRCADFAAGQEGHYRFKAGE